MKSLIASLIGLSRLLDRVFMAIACAGLTTMLACVLIQIVARYVFSEPPAWTEELARYAMIWAGFSGATVAFRRGLDPVLLKAASLPRPWMRHAALGIEFVAVALVTLTILAATPQFFALHAQRFTEALQLPSLFVVAILPVAAATIFYHSLVRSFAALAGLPFAEETVIPGREEAPNAPNARQEPNP